MPVKIKVRDLPGLIVRDLEDAARAGELRQELGRHIELLEKNQYADQSTVTLLRGYERDLTGHPACDRDQLDTIVAVVGTLRPKGGAMSERERIEKTIFYLRRAEGLFLIANDTGSFDEIRELIAALEREKQNLKPDQKGISYANQR